MAAISLESKGKSFASAARAKSILPGVDNLVSIFIL
jgi:hypothetical protein